MPTKRTTAKQATTKTATAVGGTRSVPPPFYPTESLSQTQELITDAVTAMLTHGGHRDDVDRLVRAAMSHTRRRTYTNLIDDPAELNKVAADFIRDDFDEWKEDLAATWKQNRRPERAEAKAKTITERIRANTRERVTELFDEFMTKATFEAQTLLINVLNNHSGRSMTAEHMDAENYLASAFEAEIGRDVCHLRVPERMVDDVENYVRALRAIDRAA
jgi:hypothetical protein